MEYEAFGGGEVGIWEKFRDALSKYYNLYKVTNWELVLAVDERKEATITNTDYNYLRAMVFMGDDLTEALVDHVANHEVAHVFMGEVSDFVDKVCARLDPTSQSIFLTQWEGVSERTAERISRLVERLNEGEA